MVHTNQELELAEEFIRETGASIFLTGKAGTGKTTFLLNIKKQTEKRMIVTAPTGVAAINAGGVTLHSFFQLPFGPFLPETASRHQHRFNRQKIDIIKNLDLLVIDEISMVRADLLDGVDSVLRRYRRTDLAFGGVQLLLIGDLHQLPPVVKENERQLLQQHYPSPYFFNSLALRKTEFYTIELQHIYRQADDRFISILNRVRTNTADQTTLKAINERFREKVDELQDQGYITLCSHNHSADSINGSRLTTIPGKMHSFAAEIDGEFPEHSFPTGVDLEIKRGAQVMFIRNDSSPEKRYFNGRIGKITRIGDNEIAVRCPEDDNDIIVEPAIWENNEYSLDPESMEIVENKIGTFSQYPLKLAWAITIHKSQGLTFDRAIIDAQAAFAHGQVYVALSRCRTLEGMVLRSQLSNRSIMTDPAVQRFVNHSEKNIPDSDKLAAAKIRYQQQLIMQCFDFGRLCGLLTSLVSLPKRYPGLITLSKAGNGDELKDEADRSICVVGDNFRRELQRLFTENTLPSEDQHVSERLRKAAAYFTENIEDRLSSALNLMEIETDNKELRKKAKDTLKKLRTEVAIKLAAAGSCTEPFSPSRYLRAIGSAEVSVQPARQTKQTKQAITSTEADVGHPELFETLKAWRTEKSRTENLVPFQVMHQKTLIQIAVNLPDSFPALLKIKGIGKQLAARYGEELVELVSAYRRQHHIEEITLPPTTEDDEPSPVSDQKGEQEQKKPTRLISLKLFEGGQNIHEIAATRGFAVTTIENHLGKCIERGEVEVERLLPQEKLKPLVQRLAPLHGRPLKELKETLGDDVSSTELKYALASIAFLRRDDIDPQP